MNQKSQRVLEHKDKEFSIKSSYNLETQTFTFEIDDTLIENVRMHKLQNGHLFIHQNQVYTIYIIKKDSRSFELDINGKQVVCTIYNPKEQALSALSKSDNDDTILVADMPGRVVKILVEKGQDVNLGDPLLVLEAMKMENELKSAGKKTVSKVCVQEGDTIDSGQTLIEFKRDTHGCP